MVDALNCPYRSHDKNDQLYCGLAKEIIKSGNNGLYYIDDTVCTACAIEGLPTSPKQINKVVAGRLANAAHTVIGAGGFDDFPKDRAEKLLNHIKKSFPDCGCTGKRQKRNLGRQRRRLRG